MRKPQTSKWTITSFRRPDGETYGVRHPVGTTVTPEQAEEVYGKLRAQANIQRNTQPTTTEEGRYVPGVSVTPGTSPRGRKGLRLQTPEEQAAASDQRGMRANSLVQQRDEAQNFLNMPFAGRFPDLNQLPAEMASARSRLGAARAGLSELGMSPDVAQGNLLDRSAALLLNRLAPIGTAEGDRVNNMPLTQALRVTPPGDFWNVGAPGMTQDIANTPGAMGGLQQFAAGMLTPTNAAITLGSMGAGALSPALRAGALRLAPSAYEFPALAPLVRGLTGASEAAANIPQALSGYFATQGLMGAGQSAADFQTLQSDPAKYATALGLNSLLALLGVRGMRQPLRLGEDNGAGMYSRDPFGPEMPPPAAPPDIVDTMSYPSPDTPTIAPPPRMLGGSVPLRDTSQPPQWPRLDGQPQETLPTPPGYPQIAPDTVLYGDTQGNVSRGNGGITRINAPIVPEVGPLDNPNYIPRRLSKRQSAQPPSQPGVTPSSVSAPSPAFPPAGQTQPGQPLTTAPVAPPAAPVAPPKPGSVEFQSLSTVAELMDLLEGALQSPEAVRKGSVRRHYKSLQDVLAPLGESLPDLRNTRVTQQAGNEAFALSNRLEAKYGPLANYHPDNVPPPVAVPNNQTGGIRYEAPPSPSGQAPVQVPTAPTETAPRTGKESAIQVEGDPFADNPAPASSPAPQAAPAPPVSNVPEVSTRTEYTPPVASDQTATHTYGKEDTAYTSHNKEIAFKYGLVPLDSLITSHTADAGAYAENPGYDARLQNRDRGRAGSLELINEIGGDKFNPRRLLASPSTSDGAPIIGPDNMVEGGNARALGIRKAFTDPAKAAAYQAELESRAADFGLDPAEVKRLAAEGKQPVLVRVRQGELSPEDRKALTEDMNDPITQRLSPAEQAQTDASRMLRSGILTLAKPNAEGDITTRANQSFVLAYMEKVVSASDRNELMTADGKLNPNGRRRIENALAAAAYPDPDFLEMLMETEETRRVRTAIIATAPKMAQLVENIKKGARYPLDITKDISQAANVYASIRRRGETIEEYLNPSSGNMFAEEAPIPLTQVGIALVEQMDAAKNSTKKLVDFLDSYIDVVNGAGNPQQQTSGIIAQKAPPRPMEAVQAAKELAKNAGNTSLALTESDPFTDEDNGNSEGGSGVVAPVQPHSTPGGGTGAPTKRTGAAKRRPSAQAEAQPAAATAGTPERAQTSSEAQSSQSAGTSIAVLKDTPFRAMIAEDGFAGKAFDYIPEATLARAEARYEELEELHQKVTGKPMISASGNVVRTPVAEIIRDRAVDIRAGLTRIARDEMATQKKYKNAPSDEKLQYGYDLIEKSFAPIPGILTKPAEDKVSFVAQQPAGWIAFSKPFTAAEQALFDRAVEEKNLQVRKAESGPQYRVSSTDFAEWADKNWKGNDALQPSRQDAIGNETLPKELAPQALWKWLEGKVTEGGQGKFYTPISELYAKAKAEFGVTKDQFGEALYRLQQHLEATGQGNNVDWIYPSGSPNQADIFDVVTDQGNIIRYYGMRMRKDAGNEKTEKDGSANTGGRSLAWLSIDGEDIHISDELWNESYDALYSDGATSPLRQDTYYRYRQMRNKSGKWYTLKDMLPYWRDPEEFFFGLGKPTEAQMKQFLSTEVYLEPMGGEDDGAVIAYATNRPEGPVIVFNSNLFMAAEDVTTVLYHEARHIAQHLTNYRFDPDMVPHRERAQEKDAHAWMRRFHPDRTALRYAIGMDNERKWVVGIKSKSLLEQVSENRQAYSEVTDRIKKAVGKVSMGASGGKALSDIIEAITDAAIAKVKPLLPAVSRSEFTARVSNYFLDNWAGIEKAHPESAAKMTHFASAGAFADTLARQILPKVLASLSEENTMRFQTYLVQDSIEQLRDDLTAQADGLKTQIAARQSDYAKEKAKRDTLSADIAKKKTKLRTLEDRIAVLKHEKKPWAAKATERDNLRKEITRLDRERAKLNDKLDGLQASIPPMEQSIEELLQHRSQLTTLNDPVTGKPLVETNADGTVKTDARLRAYIERAPGVQEAIGLHKKAVEPILRENFIESGYEANGTRGKYSGTFTPKVAVDADGEPFGITGNGNGGLLTPKMRLGSVPGARTFTGKADDYMQSYIEAVTMRFRGGFRANFERQMYQQWIDDGIAIAPDSKMPTGEAAIRRVNRDGKHPTAEGFFNGKWEPAREYVVRSRASRSKVDQSLPESLWMPTRIFQEVEPLRDVYAPTILSSYFENLTDNLIHAYMIGLPDTIFHSAALIGRMGNARNSILPKIKGGGDLASRLPYLRGLFSLKQVLPRQRTKTERERAERFAAKFGVTPRSYPIAITKKEPGANLAEKGRNALSTIYEVTGIPLYGEDGVWINTMAALTEMVDEAYQQGTTLGADTPEGQAALRREMQKMNTQISARRPILMRTLQSLFGGWAGTFYQTGIRNRVNFYQQPALYMLAIGLGAAAIRLLVEKYAEEKGGRKAVRNVRSVMGVMDRTAEYPTKVIANMAQAKRDGATNQEAIGKASTDILNMLYQPVMSGPIPAAMHRYFDMYPTLTPRRVGEVPLAHRPANDAGYMDWRRLLATLEEGALPILQQEPFSRVLPEPLPDNWDAAQAGGKRSRRGAPGGRRISGRGRR